MCKHATWRVTTKKRDKDKRSDNGEGGDDGIVHALLFFTCLLLLSFVTSQFQKLFKEYQEKSTRFAIWCDDAKVFKSQEGLHCNNCHAICSAAKTWGRRAICLCCAGNDGAVCTVKII